MLSCTPNRDKKLLITGSNGFLGNNLSAYFVQRGYRVFGMGLSPKAINPEVEYYCGDLSDFKTTADIFGRINPDYVINTVALVDLELCENDKSLAFKINVQTAENAAKSSQTQGSRLIHISTDHLFDGKKSFYTEDDRTSPVNNYGLTKVLGEEVCLNQYHNSVSIRTNFYGWSYPAHKPTSVEWLYQSLSRKEPIKLLVDYYFTPINIGSLAEAIEIVMGSNYKGILNIAGSERCSKYDFGLALANVFGLDVSAVTPAKIGPDFFKVKRQPDLSLSIERYCRFFKRELPDLITGLRKFKDEGRSAC